MKINHNENKIEKKDDGKIKRCKKELEKKKDDANIKRRKKE